MDLAKICMKIVPALENPPARMTTLHSWLKIAVSFATFAVKKNAKIRHLNLNAQVMIKEAKSVQTKSGKIGQWIIAGSFVDFVASLKSVKTREVIALEDFAMYLVT